MSNIALHDWRLDMSKATHRIGLAGGAVFAGALMSLAMASTAGADPNGAVGAAVTADQFSDLFTGEGTQADQAVDNFYQGIANFFAPEAEGTAFTADRFSDLFTGEGTQADRAVDNFYQGIANFFAAEPMGSAGAQAAVVLTGEGNPLDQAVDNVYQSIANFFAPEAAGNVFTADAFSDLFTGEGTMADQMVDNMYQMISSAFAPEGPIDMFLDPLLGITP
jgi:hypothetical protein